ncbi:hypothetical protein SAMN05421678_106125 [Actinopolymorpha cephalotaxi]|uniref:Uncharacterized protein n=1 Tax=Actinopolymorpha cephalotaxi TaxID=504797 RepID=A0A1I2SBV1_9ACTN|nr:hypothetical protein [Actinopolymorpha cephalotaxi]NYH87092.1 hypothetical protein [Actinopolymorpha cephalotaxi]SFG48427.1 hypothetical protein SAMN05421678_106125 [Actinopolymorpha cephalotaxi]
MGWIVLVVIALVVLLGVTYRFKGQEVIQRAKKSRVLGGSKGNENSTPPDHADMSGWG